MQCRGYSWEQWGGCPVVVALHATWERGIPFGKLRTGNAAAADRTG